MTNTDRLVQQFDSLMQLILDTEALLSRQHDNLWRMQQDVAEASCFNIESGLESVASQLLLLREDLLARSTESDSKQPGIRGPRVPAANCSEDVSEEGEGHREQSISRAYSSLTASQQGETPVVMLDQLLGYLNSVEIDDVRRHDFNEVINNTKELLSMVPMNKSSSRNMRDFISTLESSIGSFT